MGLNHCAYCGTVLELVDGTDPDEKGPNGEWSETYECQNGHTGRYKFEPVFPRETFNGACRNDA